MPGADAQAVAQQAQAQQAQAQQAQAQAQAQQAQQVQQAQQAQARFMIVWWICVWWVTYLLRFSIDDSFQPPWLESKMPHPKPLVHDNGEGGLLTFFVVENDRCSEETNQPTNQEKPHFIP